jgi:hypothetical protein
MHFLTIYSSWGRRKGSLWSELSKTCGIEEALRSREHLFKGAEFDCLR